MVGVTQRTSRCTLCEYKCTSSVLLKGQGAYSVAVGLIKGMALNLTSTEI